MRFRVYQVSLSTVDPKEQPCHGASLMGEDWFVDIKDLQELFELVAKVGQVNIPKPTNGNLVIEIVK